MACVETPPYEGNYLDLDPTVKDPNGNPVIRITASFRENENKISLFVGEKMQQLCKEAGAIQAGAAMGNSTHAHGGTRMGKNPDTKVLNEWGMAHEVPNLAIAGGSVMGTSGARNSTLTLQAVAWRTAGHIVSDWKTIVK
jgi:choline dehydrogenase-like flavoprotein